MAKLVVNTRELKNEDTFKELKKEVIEILKKQDEREVKKAIEFFSAQESRYTHLEKSITGKWIEKAGYGIGTVRIWKGKKYKKIAPGKWARVFEKEGRGTNIAIGKLIAKVQKIDNVEDLMAFVMANKQRFVDDNGIDLPVLDKLRAAVDKKNNGGIGSKGTSKPAESKYKGLTESELQKEVIKEFDNLPKENKAHGIDYYIEKIKNNNNQLYETINERFTDKAKDFFIDAAVERLTRKEKKNKKPAEKYDAKAYEEEIDNVLRHTNKDFDSVDAAIIDLNRHKNWINRKPSDETEHEKNVREARLKAVDDIIEGLKRGDNKLLDKFVKDKPAEKENPVRLKHIVSPIEFNDNHGNKIRYEIDEVKDAPEDYQNPVRVYKVEGNVRTEIAGNVKNYEDAYSAVMEQVEKTKEGTTETEKKYIDESIKTLPKEDSKGNKIEESEAEKKEDLGKDKTETKRKSIPAFTPVDKVGEKTPIAKATYVEDEKAEFPATREIKNEIKQLMKNVSKSDIQPEFQNVYYDGENLVATDAKGIKIIKIGELGGIAPDSYVKFDLSGKDKIKVEKIANNTGDRRFPNYKRVIPDGNKQKVTIDNRAFKDKIDEMLEDGSIDRDLNAISLEIKDGKILLDGDVVGSAKGVKFDDDRDFINFNYKYILNSITGDESYLMLSDNPGRPAVISTSVSDNIFMPLANSVSKVNYENNRETKKLNDKVAAENKAKNEAEKADREKRAMKGDAKKELIAERPEGVSDSDYSDLIDFADDFYTKLGYDNTTPRAKADIKKIINEAISGVQSKDFEYLDRISTVDNKIARKVFETITGIKLGSNSASAKTAWEKWVGAEAVKKHNDEIKAREQAEKDRIAAEKKAQEDSDNAQYNGFLSGKTAAGKGKAKQILSKKAGFDGKVMSYQEMADHYINNLGGRASLHEYLTASGNKKMTYGIYDKDGRGYEVPKIVYDYAMHISNNNINKSITDLILMADYAHEEFEDEEEQEEEDSFNDFSAENPDLFNSTSYKVREAMCRCGVL